MMILISSVWANNKHIERMSYGSTEEEAGTKSIEFEGDAMKYLWLGMGVSEEQERDIVANGGKILSAVVSQTAIVNGLKAQGVAMDSINAYKLPAYPRYKQRTPPRYEWADAENKNISVSYLNLKYVSHVTRTVAIKKEARIWAKQHKHEEVTVFVYSMHSPLIAGAIEVKKRIPNTKIVLIVPDLPQYMDLGMSRFKKILKAVDWLKLKGQMRWIDRYILYSRHMADFLKLPSGSWTVMEGSFDPSSLVEDVPEKADGTVSVMYSGVVDMRYGIPELLDAMELLDDNYELWITGGGNAVPLIRQRAEADARIKFFGFLPSRKELLLKQKSATMLISTRRPDEAASKYCFPSKIFEYMISGNPVLSCRIGGIPEEYFEYLVELNDTSPESIAAAVKAAAGMPAEDRAILGERGREFVLNNKSNVFQAKKILDFINEVTE